MTYDEAFEDAVYLEYPSGNWAGYLDADLAAVLVPYWNARADDNQILRMAPMKRQGLGPNQQERRPRTEIAGAASVPREPSLTVDEIRRRLAVYAVSIDGFDSLNARMQKLLTECATWVHRSWEELLAVDHVAAPHTNASGPHTVGYVGYAAPPQRLDRENNEVTQPGADSLRQHNAASRGRSSPAAPEPEPEKFGVTVAREWFHENHTRWIPRDDELVSLVGAIRRAFVGSSP